MKMSEIIIILCLLLISTNIADAEDSDIGQKTYENICSSCHSLEPPPKLAPPIRGIYMHYSMQYKDRDAFAKAIRDFAHDSEKAPMLMPQAQERFGKMPQLPLKKEELESVGLWIWNTYSNK